MSRQVIRELIAELRQARMENLAVLADFAPSDLDTTSSIRDKTLRNMLWTMYEHCGVHAVQVYNNRVELGNRVSELDGLVSLAQSSFEQLISYLGNISESEADFRPKQEEWSIRDIVEHIIAFERRYQAEFRRLLKEKAAGD